MHLEDLTYISVATLSPSLSAFLSATLSSSLVGNFDSNFVTFVSILGSVFLFFSFFASNALHSVPHGMHKGIVMMVARCSSCTLMAALVVFYGTL